MRSIILTTITWIILVTSCKKEEVEHLRIPNEFSGPEMIFPDLHDNWDWLFSASPSTIGPPSTGPITINITQNDLTANENDITTSYSIMSTLELDSLPYLHCFDRTNGEYKLSIEIVHLSPDTIQMNAINSVEGAENQAVFKRNE